MSKDLKELIKKAKAAQKHAYSPYSQVRVGTALRMNNGQIFSGTNVENSSYGGTICAERVAILKAVSELYTPKTPVAIQELVVFTEASPPWPPCGLCRQVIAEFATPSTQIHMTNPQGELKSMNFSELLPLAFVPKHMEAHFKQVSQKKTSSSK